MIRGKNIVCLAMSPWEGDYMKASVQIMSVLARHNRVIYVEYQFTYKDIITGMLRGNGIPVKRILGINKRLRTIKLEDNTEINVLTAPPIYPVNWLPSGKIHHFFVKRNARILRKAIQRAVGSRDMHSPIVVNAFNPTYGLPLVGKLNEKLLLYYCYDEISHAKWCKKHGTGVEADFAAKADAIITTSAQLQQNKKVYNDQCFLVKNGVNLELFQQAYAQKQAADATDKPLTVGYLGTIDDRLDYELLAHCIEQLPDAQFHFVGREIYPQGKDRLKNYSNVTFFGAQSPDKLAGYVAKFDIGLIPFVSNGFTQSIYPLKINEYLAAGLPVVMTNFGQVDDFREIASITSQPDEFLVAIKQLAAHIKQPEAYTQATKERLAFAASNSWDNRAEELSEVINQIIARKKTEFQKTY
ncbi:glycosyltransferase [uncultured Microscilla sp.]|uniref:glycosyltransferase n=1 Tax=uncultured Microscilla sp. TaxID=432653 RepID=UPI00260B835B|nr:glycosyltransferase [uncultured Microscilla sp.]